MPKHSLRTVRGRAGWVRRPFYSKFDGRPALYLEWRGPIHIFGPAGALTSFPALIPPPAEVSNA